MERYDLIVAGKGVSEPEESSKELKALVSGVRERSPRVETASRDQLINIRDENCEPDERSTRKAVCIEPRGPRLKEAGLGVGNVLQVHLQRGGCDDRNVVAGGNSVGNIGAKYGAIGSSAGKQKIPRPANAFMLFANEWRKKLAIQNPRESNKDISVRLGVLWKNMAKTIKEKYFALAREVDAEHKRKYPDYVYNPKEARLRKAMREQSRELSRQSILQTAIASASASGTGNGSGSGSATSSNFLSHPLQSCASSAAAVSSLSNNPAGVNSGRIINPWFPVVGPSSSSTHLKPIISPRIMAAHQRTSEKAKEAMRKQVECVGAGNVFSSGTTGANVPSGSGYGSEFGNHNAVSNGQQNDYCIIAEFGDGQKWHPYQNGAGNPYHGGRGGPGMSKVGLHPNAGGQHGPWVQFCGLPLQTSAVQNQAIRAPRQMQLFLHDQQQSQQQQQQQHCAAFSSDEMQMQSYVQSKMQEVNPRLQHQHPGYSSQGDSQVKSSVSPPQMQQLQEEVKCGDGVHRQNWGDSGGVEGGSVGVVNCNILHEQTASTDEQEDEENGADVGEDSRQKQPSSKQPLPGFHQAFGSTEIGRFSRSEFFANMVGDNGVGNTIPEAYLPAPVFPYSPTTQNVIGTSTMSSVADEDLLQIIPEDCYWLGGTPSQFGHNQSIENATNYAAFLDYSHRLTMSQEWLHPGATHQEFQAAFIDSQANLFLENNALLGHEHLSFAGFSCPGYEPQNRRTSSNCINEENINEFIEARDKAAATAAANNANKQSLVVKQNERICVMLEQANQAQIEKSIDN